MRAGLECPRCAPEECTCDDAPLPDLPLGDGLPGAVFNPEYNPLPDGPTPDEVFEPGPVEGATDWPFMPEETD